MPTMSMTLEEVRNFMVTYHGINTLNKPSGKEGLLSVFNKLGSIQYDPLNVVGRNSDLTLQSRIKNYKASLLEEALYLDRTVMDGWDKMMSIHLTKDFPYFEKNRIVRGESAISTLSYRLSLDALEYVDEILEYIMINGATYASDINLGVTKKHKWGHTKPSSATLDYLFHVGKLGIKEKRNTQKKYDLIERLIGDIAFQQSPLQNDEEYIRWMLIRRIKSMGLVWNKSSVSWDGYLIKNKSTRTKYLNKFVQDGVLTKIKVAGISDDFYVLTDSLKNIANTTNQISFIAPLDNMLWDRELIKQVFDFDYKWEVYTPVDKRKYGYYVLPILYGSTFIGRIEFEQQRNSDPLIVKKIWWEDNIEITQKILDEMEIALSHFQSYLGAEAI